MSRWASILAQQLLQVAVGQVGQVVEGEEAAAQLGGQLLVVLLDLRQHHPLLLRGGPAQDLQGGRLAVHAPHAARHQRLELGGESPAHLPQDLRGHRLDGGHAAQDLGPKLLAEPVHDAGGPGGVEGGEDQGDGLGLLPLEHHGERLRIGLGDRAEHLVRRRWGEHAVEGPPGDVGPQRPLRHLAQQVVAAGGVARHRLHGVDELLEGLVHDLGSTGAQLLGSQRDAPELHLAQHLEDGGGDVGADAQEDRGGALAAEAVGLHQGGDGGGGGGGGSSGVRHWGASCWGG